MIKTLTVLATAAALTAGAVATATPAEARWRGGGAGIAAGIIGLAAGAAVANAYGPHYGYGGSYAYAPGYAAYGGGCRYERQRVWTDFGPQWRNVRVCY